ncbi:MAG TPA: energy-coupling factor transporter transmembrane component T [Bryobacteraceae bacterium]|nr:energy-coupling factor transporter transmembrane component T [Bryobacteraceae bacterium]
MVLERWSRGASAMHTRDARVKILVTLAFLVALGTTPRLSPALAACYAALLLAGIAAARLPLAGVLVRAAAVLPFSATFAAVSLAAGDPTRAEALVLKSYLSAAAVLLLAATTPLPLLLAGLESLGVPRFLSLVIQFLYRYLFVISEQAQHMRMAALARASRSRGRRRVAERLRAAAGAVATLFARSQARAETIHGAMLARGFTGRIPPLAAARMAPPDVLFLAAGLAAFLALRLGAGAFA